MLLLLLLSRFSHVCLCATPEMAAHQAPRPWDSPGKNLGVGCHFLLQCMKVKSQSEVAQSCPTLATPWTAAHQAPPSTGFSRQEHWSGLPIPVLFYRCLSYSVVFLYFFSLITEEGFLISSCYSLELCIQMLISFLFSFAFHLSSFHSYF